jgi:spore maturation protein CgeB
MKLVIFGLTVSSSWGNGHATLWRGLCKALARRGHSVVFFERDVPYYAGHRDLVELPGGELRLYSRWDEVVEQARRELADAEAALVTSYCPDGIAASELVLESPAQVRGLYDLDTPVTLLRVTAGEAVPYLLPQGLGEFDLVLSYTGGRALDELRDRLGARWVAPLYGHVDPDVHHPVQSCASMRADLSYLGTYAGDRQPALDSLFIEPARHLPDRRFVIAGAKYPDGFPWTENIFFLGHVAPSHHAAFFASSRLTLNVTRSAMAEMGYCPSGRLFEAAACGAPVVTDAWEGLDAFFEPGQEILCARTTAEATDAIECSDAELQRIARAARERVMQEHTSDCRAETLLGYLQTAASRRVYPRHEAM